MFLSAFVISFSSAKSLNLSQVQHSLIIHLSNASSIVRFLESFLKKGGNIDYRYWENPAVENVCIKF